MARLFRRQRIADQALGLLDNRLEMPGIAEALGVNLVNILGARGTCGEPAAGRDHFQAANRSVIARSPGQLGDDFFAGQSGEAVTRSGVSFLNAAFCSGLAGASMRV